MVMLTKRIFALDFIRGFAILLMIFFNYSVTLTYFRLINLAYDFLYWFVFPRVIASIFIFVSGVVAYVTYKNSKEKFCKIYFFRGLKLLIFAILISIFTYLFVPSGAIVFGILHFFAVTSFLVPFFIKYGRLNLIAGILITLFGFYLQLITFNFSFLFWLGFIPQNFFTFDYFPIIPWLGILMLGIYFGQNVAQKVAKVKFNGFLSRFFVFFGKNSLLIYLMHQPILIFVLTILGFKLFF
jgi:uncharacterized membrane protein